MGTRTATVVDDRVEDWIMQEEGLRLKPYRCPGGALTIGYGRNLSAVGISEYEAQVLLSYDLWLATDVVRRMGDTWAWVRELDAVRRAVLVGMAFQLGEGGLRKFRGTLGCVERGDYAGAAEQMLKSKWAKQTPGRAKRCAEMMRTGEWPVGV